MRNHAVNRSFPKQQQTFSRQLEIPEDFLSRYHATLFHQKLIMYSVTQINSILKYFTLTTFRYELFCEYQFVITNSDSLVGQLDFQPSFSYNLFLSSLALAQTFLKDVMSSVNVLSPSTLKAALSYWNPKGLKETLAGLVTVDNERFS